MAYVEWDDVVTTIDNSSTNSEIPTAKAVNDIVTNINTVLSDMVTPVGATPTTADYLSQLDSDRDDLADNLVTMGVVASQSEPITDLVPKVLQISGGGTDWGDTITDDWDTIIANATAGTVSGYSEGDTKTLEFLYDGKPFALRFRIWDKSHDTISGSNPSTTASLSFVSEDIVILQYMNDTGTNVGGWLGTDGDHYANSLDETGGVLDYGCAARKLLWQIYKSFPTNIKNGIKTVDKIYDDSNGLQTAKDKLFLLSTKELGLTYSSELSGQGTAYSYPTDATKRTKSNPAGTANPYWARSRNKGNTTGFCAIKNNGTATNATATNTAYGLVIGFCL